MNKMHITIITLLSIVQCGLANEPTLQEILKERIKKAQSLSNKELQKEFVAASHDVIAADYTLKQSSLALEKCLFQNKNNQKACDNLAKQYAAMSNDSFDTFDAIVSEKHRRQLYQGLKGRGCAAGIIGITNFNNGLADLYRLDKALHTKSNQELREKQTNIANKCKELSNLPESDKTLYHDEYQTMAQTKQLGLERELNMPHRKHNDETEQYKETYRKLS